MRIVIIIFKFLPMWIGGTEIATYNISKELIKRGHEVHIVTSLDAGLPKDSIYKEICVHRIGWEHIKYIGITHFWLKIVIAINEINPDIIHVQSPSMGLPGLCSKIILRKPLIIYARGSEIYLSWRFKKPLLKLVMKNADTVIALTNNMKTVMKSICDRDIAVISNGINLNRFKNNFHNNMYDIDKKIVLFVGTLRPVKGVEYLIESMKYVIEKDKNVKLMLIGDGEDRSKLEHLVQNLNLQEYIDFMGHVENEVIPDYMAHADVFVLPSISEGFPVVLLEAMASGLPIIATKINGIEEFIKEGINGFLVEPKNPYMIAEKIVEILDQDELKIKLSENNKKTALNYSLESVVDKLENIYKNRPPQH